MTRKFQLVLAVLILASMVSVAYAQYEDDGPSKFGFRVVSFMPSDGDLKSLKSLWIGPALDWHISFDEDGKPDQFLTLGLISSGDGRVKATEEFLTYTKINRTPISDSRSHYTGFGGGINRVGIRASGFEDKSFKLSAHVLYGQEFNDIYYAEIRYDITPKWRDASWGGLSLSVGTRVSF